MLFEELRDHILYLLQRNNATMDEDKFEMEMKILLKYVDRVMKNYSVKQ